MAFFRRKSKKGPAPCATPITTTAVPLPPFEDDTETTDYSPKRNYGKLALPAIAVLLLTYHFASPYVTKKINSIRGGDKQTEEKGKKQSNLEKLVCKDEYGNVIRIIYFDPKKPGDYACDKPKPETPAESDLEKETNKNTPYKNTTPDSGINNFVLTPADNSVEPSKVGNPYTQENKMVQEVDGIPQAKEIANYSYKGVMTQGSLQFSPDLKHIAWFTWFSPTNSRGNVYVADVSFDEKGELHVYKEDIKAVKTYSGLTGPRVTDISWSDSNNLEVVTDNIVRKGKYGLRTSHVPKSEKVKIN